MEAYSRKYRKLLTQHKIFLILYCAIAAMSFLGGIVGFIICGSQNIEALLTMCGILSLVVPIVMLILYLVCLQWLWDKRFDRMNSEIQNSSLSADEVMDNILPKAEDFADSK